MFYDKKVYFLIGKVSRGFNVVMQIKNDCGNKENVKANKVVSFG